MWSLGRSLLALEPEGVRCALPRYIDVVRGNLHAKFILNGAYQANYGKQYSIEHLWKIHQELLEGYKSFEEAMKKERRSTRVKNSFLDLKVELARRIMTSCHFCERRCGVNRLEGEKGYCNCSNEFAVSTYFAHTGEEPELVPSGTIFTSGCSIRCIHCQNYEISQWFDPGTPISSERMAGLVSMLRDEGCRNINMVGGDPTPNTWLWLDAFRHVDSSIATVWNSNSYYSSETARLLAGFIDVYLLDFKYGNNECASNISDAKLYWETCTRNHLTALAYGELIIRVLVLPGHNECCTKPILEWISKELGPYTRVNLMFQFRPEWRARERTELSRRLNEAEIVEALKMANDAGLRNLVKG